MPKDNLLFKLDNLEYQYHYLTNTLESFEPRLNQTKKYYNAKGKKTSQRIAKLWSSLTVAGVEKEMDQMRLKIFDGKLYTVEKNLKKSLNKKMKNDYNKCVLKICSSVDEFINYVVLSKLIKMSISKIIGNKKSNDLNNVPKWFQKHKYLIANNDKSDDLNPSRIWNDIVMKVDGGVKIVGILMNDKKSQEILKGFENGMDVFLGINRENKIEKSKKLSKEEETNQKKRSRSDDEGEDEGDEEEYDEDENVVIENGINEDELVARYDGLIAGSEDEEEESSNEDGLDPNINYNEVTDEEPSEVESDDDEESDDDDEPSRKRAKLPELMTGYYSGDDDDSESDIEEDKIAREQASNKIKRKNRRGQRARRKIWEQKYGKSANHVQKEIIKEREAREQRQREYEARVAKRAAKQAEYDKTNINLLPLGVRGSRSRNEVKTVEEPKKKNEDHPSWVAKKLAEEKLKNAKFTGKKITFD